MHQLINHVWIPLEGCAPVSDACRNCRIARSAQKPACRVTLPPERLKEPLRWRKPRRVLTCGAGDLFHPDVNTNYQEQIWRAMLFAKKHKFIVLTRYADRMLKEIKHVYARIFADYEMEHHYVPDNIWLVVAVQNQKAADDQIPVLLQIKAAVRGVSVGPEPVNLDKWLKEIRYCEKHGQLCDDGVTWENGLLVCKYCRRPVDKTYLLDLIINCGSKNPEIKICHLSQSPPNDFRGTARTKKVGPGGMVSLRGSR